MALNNKLSEIRVILETHNAATIAPIDIEAFFRNLTNMGGSSEATLIHVTWEDLEACGAPRILARRIALLFQNKQSSKMIAE